MADSRDELIEDLRQQIDALQLRRVELTDMHRAQQLDVEAANAAAASMQSLAGALQSENADLRAGADSVRAENLAKQVETLQAAPALLSSALEAQRAENVKLRAENARLRAELEAKAARP